MKYSRQDYVNGKCDHDTYYAQFVTERTIEAVRARFKKQIEENKPLKEWGGPGVWDGIGLHMDSMILLEGVGEGFSLSNAICINKAAAEIILKK